MSKDLKEEFLELEVLETVSKMLKNRGDRIEELEKELKKTKEKFEIIEKIMMIKREM